MSDTPYPAPDTKHPMTLLITGGAGFIGSALIRHLITHTPHHVVNLDKLTYAGNLESLAPVSENSRYIFEQVDICDAVEVTRCFDQYRPHAVLHLAAESDVDRSIDGPAAFIETNITGTYTLLEAARSHYQSLDAPARESFRFLHVSTDEVFGDLADTGGFFTEQTPYAPSSPYSASKASSDHLVRAWHRTFGLPVLVTHCSNNYGPCQFPEKMIPLMILNALEGKPLPVYGKGENIRDWLHVDDHVKALCRVLTHGFPGTTYNIGGCSEKTNLEVIHTLCRILDEQSPDQAPHAALITHVPDRPGHDLRYAINTTKIQAELGWTPEETFDTGIRKTVIWYLQNPGWCCRVMDGTYQERHRLGLT